MSLRYRSGLRLAAPVFVGGRLFVPIVRMISLSHGHGGMGHAIPVALLVGEGRGWSFVPLEDGIGRDILPELELPPAGSPGGGGG